MMKSLNERAASFETKFGRDQDMKFKAEMRRNRKIGAWAGGELGLTGDQMSSYIDAVMDADFDKPGDDDVCEKILTDFKNKGIDISQATVKKMLQHFLDEAKAELMDGI